VQIPILKRPGSKAYPVLKVPDIFSRGPDTFSQWYQTSLVGGHVLVSEKSTEVATALLLSAMARHGKPEAVRTDRGGEFLGKAHEGDFARVLETS